MTLRSEWLMCLHDGGQMAVKNCFIRGSVVRYVQMPKSAINVELLEDATRKGESRSLAL